MIKLILFFATFCHPHFCQPVLTGKNQWLKPLNATACHEYEDIILPGVLNGSECRRTIAK